MIIAFDPGVTTGIAVLESNGEVVNTYAVAFGDMTDEFVSGLARTYKDASVVVEEPPLRGGNYRPITQQIEETLRRTFPSILWVPPGQWKGHPAARSSQALPRLTQHEKDAVGLGRWYRARLSRA